MFLGLFQKKIRIESHHFIIIIMQSFSYIVQEVKVETKKLEQYEDTSHIQKSDDEPKKYVK